MLFAPRALSLRRPEAIAARELHEQIIADGHCGPIQRFAVSPRLPTEAITPETLRPEHLDELTSLAEGCLEAIWHACLYAENARRTEEDRWDLQSVLVTAMNTGLRAGLFLWAGLENEILGAVRDRSRRNLWRRNDPKQRPPACRAATHSMLCVKHGTKCTFDQHGW